MSVLVIGGTGTVGSATVKRLVDAGVDTRVMTSSPSKVGSLPEGVDGVYGDLAQPETLPPALEGIGRLFLVTPLHPDEDELGRTAVEAAAEAGVEHVVFLSIHEVERGRHVPHFASKMIIEQAIREEGLPHTLLMATNFFHNDLLFREALLEHGVYPQPIGGRGLTRVDVRDIADAATAALTRPDHAGGRYPLVGPDSWTGERTAAVWGRVLERPVRYLGDDLDAWEKVVLETMPGWLIADLRKMYAYFQREGLEATEDDLARQAELLDHPPRRFEDFAAETADAWRS